MKHWIESSLEDRVQRALRQQRWWEFAQAAALGVISGVAIYWLGIGW